ncbi:aspartyl protease family protein [Phaeodactylibacter luteus]|uniref:PDZ domain-containing protein n=1 Tax=Phaeodactylibacter luteus TaxID=1564516 RepID=A0A5C6RGS5_9BACT|nr:aspartyl protease family protein [Phaeodactylibacter luteus]TXB60638.1 PDZ domain-containing protein [Phaeodactylibacter luteus]
MAYKLWAVPFLLVLTGCASSQLWDTGSLKQEQFIEEIPVRLVNGLIFLDVEADGRPLTFLLDTGAPTIIDEGAVEALNLPVRKYGTAQDAYGRRDRINRTRIKHLKIGGLDFRNQPALISPLRTIPVFNCLEIDGLLGANLMKRAYWQFDYERERLLVTDQLENLPVPESALQIPFRTKAQGTPIIDLRIGDSLSIADVTLDFGSGNGLTLERSLFPEEWIKKAEVYTDGIAGVGLYGAAMDSVWYREMPGLFTTQGDTVAAAVFLRVKRGGSHLLGTELLRHFRVTIDWRANMLYLEPRGEVVQTWRGMGFSVTPEEDGLVVSKLVYPSPAVDAGLQLGDRLVKVDGERVGHADFCWLLEQFREGDGPVSLGFEREGEGDIALRLNAVDIYGEARKLKR